MKPTIKIPWDDFVAYAMAAIKLSGEFPVLNKNKDLAKSIEFMKAHSHDPDGKCYELPEYVEITIELENKGKTS